MPRRHGQHLSETPQVFSGVKAQAGCPRDDQKMPGDSLALPGRHPNLIDSYHQPREGNRRSGSIRHRAIRPLCRASPLGQTRAAVPVIRLAAMYYPI
jgi:hypothetical protein